MVLNFRFFFKGGATSSSCNVSSTSFEYRVQLCVSMLYSSLQASAENKSRYNFPSLINCAPKDATKQIIYLHTLLCFICFRTDDAIYNHALLNSSHDRGCVPSCCAEMTRSMHEGNSFDPCRKSINTIASEKKQTTTTMCKQ